MANPKPDFVGLDTHYVSADGASLRRVHLDGAASPLPSRTALTAMCELLPHYSNTHSHVHNSARISSEAFNWARQRVLRYLAADSETFTSIFMGAGTTAAVNRVVRGLSKFRNDKPVVLVSAMEHHGNDLPHRQFGNEVHYIPLTGSGADQGCIDLAELESMLQAHADQVNYIAFSAVSNVTGLINPVSQICKLARRYGALTMVDAAQAVAHLKIDFSAMASGDQPDFFIFSGHKVYCPTAPGVLVARKDLLQEMSGQDLGGGAVEDVSYYDYELSSLPDREQAGTPNIVGAISLAKVLDELDRYGREKIETHGRTLMVELLESLRSFTHLQIYGDENADRIGAVSFTHDHIEHGLLAAILNDYHMIAVRNECFCAHPYVSSLLKENLWQLDLSEIPSETHNEFINRYRGMVRVSLSLYNGPQDIDRLVQALEYAENNVDELRQKYDPLPDGNFKHKRYAIQWQQELGWQ